MRRSNKSPNNSAVVESKNEISSYSSSMMPKQATRDEVKEQSTTEEEDAEGSRM
jgi:hypothetical protein